MARKMKHKIAAGAGAALAVAGGGAAIAATQLSPKAESQAVVDDAAKQLGVDPTKLSDALKQALQNRVDAAVAAGTLTKAQGDELKARIESDDFPLFGGRGGLRASGHHGAASAGTSPPPPRTSASPRRRCGRASRTARPSRRSRRRRASPSTGSSTRSSRTRRRSSTPRSTAGKLDEGAARRRLADAKQRLQDLVDGKAPARRPFRDHDGFGFARPAAPAGGSDYRFGGGATPASPAASGGWHRARAAMDVTAARLPSARDTERSSGAARRRAARRARHPARARRWRRSRTSPRLGAREGCPGGSWPGRGRPRAGRAPTPSSRVSISVA